MQGELQVVIAARPPPHPVDQDHVGVVADGEVRGVPGGVGEPAQVRRRDLAQLQRSQHREPQVQDTRAEAVLPGRFVLLEIAEHSERRYVAVGRAAGEGEPAGQVADPQGRTVGGERAEDREAALK
jgi:hypothetical protein